MSASPLASPGATRAVLDAYGLATKHRLGQNFLVNDHVVQKILDLAQIGPSDVDGFRTEFLEQFRQFQGSLARTGSGCFVAFYHIDFCIFGEAIDLFFDLVK